jgi:hypothetical protein
MRSGNVQILAVEEDIKTNYSSHCLAQTLDDLIFKFIEIAVSNTTFVEAAIVELIVHVFTDSRRKLSKMPKQDLQNQLFSFIVCEKQPSKLKLLRDARIERSIYFKILKIFMRISEEYINEVPNSLKSLKPTDKILALEREAQAHTSNFNDVCARTLFWSKPIYDFRNSIVKKYIRFAKVEANKAVGYTALNISKDDLHKGFIESIFKAIDKYDSSSGTLTEYIQWWFMDAKTNQSYHEEGVAYSIPTQLRKKLLDSGVVNISQPIDQNTIEILTEDDACSTILNEQEHIVIANLVCRSDTHKVFSILSGIRYNLTPEDIETQQSTLNEGSY